MISSRGNRRYAPILIVLPSLISLILGFAFGISFRSKPPPLAEPDRSIVPPPKPVSSPALPAPRLVPPLDRLRALASSASSQRSFSLSEAILLIGQLELPECAAARSFFGNLSRNDREILLDALANRWAQLDPVNAFDNAQATRRENDWSNRIGFAAGAVLAERDPEAALERITTARNNDLREKAAEWVLPAMARSQGLRAAEYLSANNKLNRFEHIYRSVAHELGRSSPLDAIEWAKSLSSKSLRDQSLASAWQGWAETDPVAVVAAMQNDHQPKQLDAIVGTIAHVWSRSDLTATLAWIESLRDGGMQNAAYASLWLDPAQLSHDTARNLLSNLTSDRVRDDFAQKIGQQLALENIPDALAWAENLPDDKGRSPALISVLQQWTANDPLAASQYVTSQPESKERSQNLAHVVNLWSQSDPDAAYAFVQTLAPGHARDTALGSVIEIMSQQEPAKALEMFRSVQDSEVVGRLSERLIGSLIKSDPTAALQLASQIPPESQPKTYYALIRGWAFDQPRQAGEWLNSLSPGVARDSAIKAYVSVIDGMDAALATQWAVNIQEPTERAETTLGAFSRWAQNDKAAARVWLDQSEIPESLRPYFDRVVNDER
jgi:hypothetical protein